MTRIGALNSDGSVTIVSDLALGSFGDDRIIGRDAGSGFLVSTVFLGVEHMGGMWFETLVWEGEDPVEVDGRRYATCDAAKQGHAELVAKYIRPGLTGGGAR